MSTCPHCGERLPSVVDAFCPDCFTALDEPSAKEKAAFGLTEEPTKEEPANAWQIITAMRLMLVGVCVLFAGALAAARGHWAEALYTLGGGLAVIIFGAWQSAGS